MKKYDTYRSSEIEWLDVVPSNWKTTRLKYLGQLYGGLTGKSGQDFKNEDNLKNRPYIPYTNIFKNTYISNEHYHYVLINEGENQNRVKKFDLFFLMSSETHQDLGKSCIIIDDVDELYLNSFCKGLRILSNEVDPLFLNYQLLGHLHKELLSVEGKGFTRINLRQDKVNDLIIFLPPLHEQEQIVKYLDKKTSIIDKLISTKQRKIELLKQQRSSLINEVITKGLDPNVKMKDSGVEWIGEIPESWIVSGFTRFVNIRHGFQFREFDFTDDGIKVVKITQLDRDGYLNLDNCSYINRSRIDEFQRILILENDILMCLTGGTIGKIIKVGKVGEPLVQNYRVGHFSSLNNQIKNDFIFWFMSSHFMISQIFFEIRENGQPNIGIEDFRKMKLTIPPINEQQQIVEYLNKHTQEIDDLVQMEQKKIETLKEYRQSLISEVITGKIKVVE